MEHPRTLDVAAIHHLKGTDYSQLYASYYSYSFTFNDNIQKQRLLETKQPLFHITKLNTFHYGAFARITKLV